MSSPSILDFKGPGLMEPPSGPVATEGKLLEIHCISVPSTSLLIQTVWSFGSTAKIVTMPGHSPTGLHFHSADTQAALLSVKTRPRTNLKGRLVFYLSTIRMTPTKIVDNV